MSTDRDAKKPFLLPTPGDEEITDQKFEELMNLTIEMVDTVAFSKKEDHLVPVMFVHYREIEVDANGGGMLSDVQGAIIMIPNFPDTQKEKHDVLRKVGGSCVDRQMIPVAFFLATEACMVTRDPNDPRFDEPPSKSENRKEVISIVGRTMTGDCKASMIIPVRRGENKEFIKDGEPLTHMVKSTKEQATPLLDQFIVGYVARAVEKYNIPLKKKP